MCLPSALSSYWEAREPWMGQPVSSSTPTQPHLPTQPPASQNRKLSLADTARNRGDEMHSLAPLWLCKDSWRQPKASRQAASSTGPGRRLLGSGWISAAKSLCQVEGKSWKRKKEGRTLGHCPLWLTQWLQHSSMPSQARWLAGLPLGSFHSVWNPVSDSYGMKKGKDKLWHLFFSVLL